MLNADGGVTLPAFRLILTDADTLTTVLCYTVSELQENLELSLGIFRNLHMSEADGCGDLWVVWHSPV